jgi:two-component system, OmpR family, alkaline phosphatase synthesis response regulator PhoP
VRTNILVIEDDKDVIDVLGYFLAKENYRVHVARDGLTALDMAAKVVPNLILLDLKIPRLDGIEVCKSLKSDPRLKDIPVIMVTAKGEESDKIEGLDTGADDYVTKPFSPGELVARVRAHLRRSVGNVTEKKYHYGNISVDTVSHVVSVDGKEVELTIKEFELLLYLIENKGRVLTRDMILNHIWGYGYFGTSRTVDVHITQLRRKITMLSDAITTVKSLGYKLREDAAS